MATDLIRAAPGQVLTREQLETIVSSSPDLFALAPGPLVVTVSTDGFVDFSYTYFDDGNPATFWGLLPNGDQRYITYQDNPFGVVSFITVPAPAKPAATSTAGTVNTSPPLFQAIGSPIPIIWGKIRVQGAQLWSSAAYAGGGVGNVADCAVAWGTPLETNGIVNELFTTRLWGNSNLFFDSSSGGSSVGSFGMIDYPGDERQLADPTLVTYTGTTGTPAFRGLIYTFFKGLPLAAFNNSVVSTTFSDELTYLGTFGRYNLTYVLEHLSQRGGFAPSSFTMTGIDDACDGGQITSSTDFITLLQGFATIYNFVILEHPLRLKRIPVGSSLVINKTIHESECISTSATDDVVLVSDAEPWTIPNQISLSYIAASRDYQVATVPVKRPIFPFGLTGPVRNQNYSLPLVVTDDEAANLAWLYLYRLWVQAKTITFTALPMHADVEPGDVIQIVSQGVTYTAFVSRSSIKPDFSNQITATGLLTNTTVDLNAHPGALLPPVLVCPTTDWTTLDPLDVSAAGTAVGTTVSNCGLLATCTIGNGGARSTSMRTSGKYFFQVTANTSYGAAMGVAEAGTIYGSPNGYNTGNGAGVIQHSGFMYSNATAYAFHFPAMGGDDVVSIAVDLDTYQIWFKVNSSDWNNVSVADPASGAHGISMSAFAGQPMSPIVSFTVVVKQTFACNFGQSSFLDKFGTPVPVPAGFTHGWPT